jgi:flagellar protein FlaG
MDVKSDIALTITPAPAAGASRSAASNMPDAVSAPAGKGAGAPAPEQAAVQKVLRQALNLEPVPNRELRIEFENDLHVIVVKVLDKDSGEVIRQIPMPESIALAKRIQAQISRMAGEQRGFAVDQEV